MSEKLLITQALDERDLLVKKINAKINSASFLDTIKNNEVTVAGARIGKEEFAKQAAAAFQQINDLIARFQKIDAAIVASNATTKIQTSYGEFTIAGAISLRGRLRGTGAYRDDAEFEGTLLQKMERDLYNKVQSVDEKNRKMQSAAEQMRLTLLGKDTKTKDDTPLAVVESYVRENTTVLVDPLGIEKMIEEMKEKRDTLLRELDTQIKVSNATTYIEI